MSVETDINKRWEQGKAHHPKSILLFESLMKIDWAYGSDFFHWKKGGDGDNGEMLMYEMDIHFEQEDEQLLTSAANRPVEALYAMLPSGNQDDFERLDQEARARGIDAHFLPLRSGGRIYRILPAELHKLPSDEQGPYLGTAESGYSLYPLPDIANWERNSPGTWQSALHSR